MLSNLDLRVREVMQSKGTDLDFRSDMLNHKIPVKKTYHCDDDMFKPLLDEAIDNINKGKPNTFVWTKELEEKFGFDAEGNDIRRKK